MVASGFQGFPTAISSGTEGRVDVNGRVEEIIDGILDSEAQKPKSSCLAGHSAEVKTEEKGSEREY